MSECTDETLIFFLIKYFILIYLIINIYLIISRRSGNFKFHFLQSLSMSVNFYREVDRCSDESVTVFPVMAPPPSLDCGQAPS